MGTTPVAHAATFTVNSTSDAPDSNTLDGVCDDGLGNCTLRAAIEQANASAGPHTIAFNIGSGGSHTISLGSVLPQIIRSVTIDGSSQPGFAGAPLIDIDAGSLAVTFSSEQLCIGFDGCCTTTRFLPSFSCTHASNSAACLHACLMMSL